MKEKMMEIQPLDVRVRELWKAVAAGAAEREDAETSVWRADNIVLEFLDRFYPNDHEANVLRNSILNKKGIK